MDFGNLAVDDSFLSMSLMPPGYYETVTMISGYARLQCKEDQIASVFPHELTLLTVDFYFDAFLPYFKQFAIVPCMVQTYRSKSWTCESILLNRVRHHDLVLSIGSTVVIFSRPHSGSTFSAIRHILKGYNKTLWECLFLAYPVNQNLFMTIVTDKNELFVLQFSHVHMVDVWVKGLRLLSGQLDTTHANQASTQHIEKLISIHSHIEPK
mmetsp:Transcript_12333/g.18608  ORF Transcript_12333/g.18608 Transcript_12333/m.18608 type:complete len:210 (-) Transcript_12333:67-696(-)